MKPKFEKTGEIFIEEKKGVETPSFVYVAASSVSSFGAATSSDQKIYTFDSEKSKIISTWNANTGPITGLALNDKAQLLASCSTDDDKKGGNELMLWDIRSSANVATFYPNSYQRDATLIETCSISCEGSIVGCGTDFGILLWDVRRPECKVDHVDIMSETIASMAFHPFINSCFVAGDDDGNLLIYDIDGEKDEEEEGDEEHVIFAINDGQPVYQCGFCGGNRVFTLRRTAGMAIWDFIECESLADYDDVRPLVGNSFNYPIDIHWAGDFIMLAGGDSEGGVSLSMCSENNCDLFHKIDNAHKDCINATHLSICEGGSVIKLFLAGDGGQLSFWRVVSE